MRRTTALLALFPLALALGACGDDGDGGDAAFCELAEELAQEGDPDLDLIEEAADAAPSEIEDEMEQLLAALRAEEEGEEIDEDDIDELVEAGEAVEEFTAEECDVDLSGDNSGDDSDDSDDTTTTTEADDDEETTTTEADSGGGDDEAGEPDEPPSLDDPELDALAQECFEGSGQACDDLFFQTDVGSEEEEYGNTCGGRFDESPGLCSEAIGE